MTSAAKLFRVLQLIFRQQARDAASKITTAVIESGRAPDMHHWVPATAAAIKPVMLQLFQQGLVHTAAKLGVRAEPRLGPVAQAVLDVSGNRYAVGNAAAFGQRKSSPPRDIHLGTYSSARLNITVSGSQERLFLSATTKPSEADWLNPSPRLAVEGTINLNPKERTVYGNRLDALVSGHGYGKEVFGYIMRLLGEAGYRTMTSYVQYSDQASQSMMGKLGGEPGRETDYGRYWNHDLTKPQKSHRHSSFFKQVFKAAGLGAAFDIFNPRVLDAVDSACMVLCRSTLDTATTDLTTAIQGVRDLLKRGLPKGQALLTLSRKVQEIFASPQRAELIALTESTRALNGGRLLAASDSGKVSEKEWVASANSCERCLDLDGKRVKLHEPFIIVGSGPYAVVQFPPLHPRCDCSWEEIFSEVMAA